MSTVAYLLLYSLLRLVLDPLAANAAALLVTAVGNTAANRRFTFRRTGRHRRVRHHLAGLGVFGVGLAITTCALALLAVLVPQPSRAEELACLVVANGLATLARFVILRAWVFPDAAHPAKERP